MKSNEFINSTLKIYEIEDKVANKLQEIQRPSFVRTFQLYSKTVHTNFTSADKYPIPMVIIVENKHTPLGVTQFIPS